MGFGRDDQWEGQLWTCPDCGDIYDGGIDDWAKFETHNCATCTAFEAEIEEQRHYQRSPD